MVSVSWRWADRGLPGKLDSHISLPVVLDRHLRRPRPSPSHATGQELDLPQHTGSQQLLGPLPVPTPTARGAAQDPPGESGREGGVVWCGRGTDKGNPRSRSACRHSRTALASVPGPLKRALALSAGPEGQAVPPAAASPWQALPVERKRSLEPSRSSPPPQGPAFGGSRTPSTSDMGEEGRAASGGPTGLETSESLSDSLYDSLSSCGSQG